MLRGIIYGINNIFTLLYLIILIRILISWIPSVDIRKQPWFTIVTIADAYLRLFRPLIPPIGGMDWSPTIALIVLFLIQGALNSLLGAM